jgi:hypothetical protein
MAMSPDATLLPLGQQQFFDSNGKPLAGGSVTFFVPNTTTLKNTWQDPDQTTLNTNPVLLSASGSAVIYGHGSYVQEVRDADGTVIWTRFTSTDVIWPSLAELGGASLSGDNIWTGFNQFNATVTIYGAAMNWSEAPAIASDTVVDLQSMAGNKGSITLGTANPIESVILNQGAIRFMRFLTPVSLTAGPLFVMPEGLTAAETGDCAIFEGEAGGRVRISHYQRADGQAVNTGSTGGSASSSISGNASNLKVIATPGVLTGSISATEITLQSLALRFVTGRNLALTWNGGVVGLNGLDAGTMAIDTWYSVWVISNGTGTFASLLSLDASAPTMPTGYTFKTRIGWIRMSGTAGQQLGSRQAGKRATWTVDGTVLTGLPEMLGVSQGSLPAPTWVAIATGDFVAPTAVIATAQIFSDGMDVYDAMLAPNDQYGANDDTSNPPLAVLRTGGGMPVDVVLESSDIYGATGPNGYVFSVGWVDV